MSNKLLEQYYSQANIDINDVKYTFYDVYSVSIIPESDGDGCWGCIPICCCAFPCVYTICTGNPCCCGSL